MDETEKKQLVVEMRVFMQINGAKEFSISDILEFHRMSVEEICKKPLHEPSVSQTLTTEYKPVVNIPDNVQFI